LVGLFDLGDASVTASVTKLMRVLFFDPRFQNSFTESDGFLKIAKSLEMLSPTLSSSDESKKAIEEIFHFLVAASQVPNLRLEVCFWI
jgi:vacuolar-type H+-ATPase catalytic subunit A/Vma1